MRCDWSGKFAQMPEKMKRAKGVRLEWHQNSRRPLAGNR